MRIAASFHTEGWLDLTSLAPKLTVFVDGRRLKTRWRRRGNRYTTKVARRFVDKPVLLSVVAKDKSGNVLGRAFREILGTHRSVVAADPSVRHLLE